MALLTVPLRFRRRHGSPGGPSESRHPTSQKLFRFWKKKGGDAKQVWVSLRQRLLGAKSADSSTGKSAAQQPATSTPSKTGITAAEPPVQDPIGLKVIYRPVGERRADIVFIHGLGGSSRMTWCQDRNPDLFWPLKFLPQEPDIRECRILTFGYNANFRPGSKRSNLTILDFAKELLHGLKYAQDESAPEPGDVGMGEKPIIFVVHSMGGLVVKEAYMLGHYDPTYKSIIAAVSAIIFLSTPHRGTNLAESLNRILQISLVASPMQFISELVSGSLTIENLNEQFRHFAPKLQIFSFYETRPTLVLKSPVMVLEKRSSVLGYPGEVSRSLDADHHGVCKYASRDDPKYIVVRNALKSLVEKPKGSVTEEKNKSASGFKKYLRLSEPLDADHNLFHERWTPGTCNWITTHETFAAWLEDVRPSLWVLWVSGQAACGKSILSSFLVNHMVQQGLSCHYFYMRSMSQKKREMGLMLRSLACQLASSIPAYAARLRKLEASDPDLQTEDYQNMWQKLFKQTLFRLHLDHPVYLVIDGVDEANEPDSVIPLLSDLHLAALPLRVLIAGRKTYETSSAFQKLAKHVHLETIPMEEDTTMGDVRSYTEYEMDLAGDDQYRKQVVSRLLERAQGNFLWVHLVVQSINACYTKVDVERSLVELPSGMEALYDRMALSVQSQSQLQSSTSNKNLGWEILAWVACARRPLSVGELCDALEDDFVEMHRTIDQLCGGFVTVDREGVVALVHETARTYLMREGEPDKDRRLVEGQAAHTVLLTRCLACLIDGKLRARVHRNNSPALLGYAAAEWTYHFVSTRPTTYTAAVEAAASFLEKPRVLTWIYVVAKSGELGPLAVASRHLGDVAVELQRTMGSDGDGDVAATRIQAAVHIVEDWAVDLVNLVGRFGNVLRRHPDMIYRMIPPFCPQSSRIYRQFGHREGQDMQVSGIADTGWDSCLARLSPFHGGAGTSSIIATESRIILLAVAHMTSQLVVYGSSAFEEQRRFAHPERVETIQANRTGSLVVSYGDLTTRVWEISTGACLKAVRNPSGQLRPQCLLFGDEQGTVFSCSGDGWVMTFSFDDESNNIGGSAATEWTSQFRVEEQDLGGDTVDTLDCSALSPDGNMIAFACRGHPLTVWGLEPPMLLGQCSVEPSETATSAITWHPSSSQVFGLALDGTLFRWNLYEPEASAKVCSTGSCMALSRDGSLVATGNVKGDIKIYATADLSIRYRLWAEGEVRQLAFSADSRHLYDARGFYADVWDLSTLAPVHTIPDSSGGSLSGSEDSISSKHNHSARSGIVTCLAGQSTGPFYCYGSSLGIVTLCEIGQGRVCEVGRLASQLSTLDVAWSDDGLLVAFTDLDGHLTIKRASRSAGDPTGREAPHELHPDISPGNVVDQLIFHPTGSRLFAFTRTSVFFIGLASLDVIETLLEPTIGARKWACHPLSSNILLGFGTSDVYVLDGTDIRRGAHHTYAPSRGTDFNTSCSSDSDPNRIPPPTCHLQRRIESLGRLISSAGCPHIILQIQVSNSPDHIRSEYLCFDVKDQRLEPPLADDSDMTGGADRQPAEKLIPYELLPPEVASRIREPLAFLSQRRFVFLNVDRWICTWRVPVTTISLSVLPSAAASHNEKGQLLAAAAAAAAVTKITLAPANIEQLYCLPGDWVNTDEEARLCTVTPDGTLLCPRKGEVAAVQATNLREY